MYMVIDMNDRQMCITQGKHPDTLSAMKHADPEKYRYVKSIGIAAYENLTEEIKAQVGDIYWELKTDEHLKLSDFYRDMLMDLFQSQIAYLVAIGRFPFRQNQILLPLKTINKYQEVIRRYDIWKKERL